MCIGGAGRPVPLRESRRVKARRQEDDHVRKDPGDFGDRRSHGHADGQGTRQGRGILHGRDQVGGQGAGAGQRTRRPDWSPAMPTRMCSTPSTRKSST